jgi:hypothetical protein
MERISIRDATGMSTNTITGIPLYYALFGKNIRIFPIPSGVQSVRMWYLKDPDALVVEQGRITIANLASNYIIVDGVGSSLTTEVDELNSFVSIVDAQTGIVKTSMQIQSITGNKITFKSIPSRASVYNKTIAQGTCVPFYGKPLTNFLIQYAVAEIQKKFGGDAALELSVLAKFEQQVERTWAGREVTLKVQPRSSQWSRRSRRIFPSS